MMEINSEAIAEHFGRIPANIILQHRVIVVADDGSTEIITDHELDTDAVDPPDAA